MPRHAKTHKRKHHSKTSRRAHRRMTHRRKTRRGGADCDALRAEFEKIKESVEKMTANTSENEHGNVRHLHNEVVRVQSKSVSLRTRAAKCEKLRKEIEEYENTTLQKAMNKVLRSK